MKIVLKILVSLAFLLPLSVIIHEGGHWLTGFIYGVPGRLEWFAGNNFAQITWKTTPDLLTYYAGGLLAFIVLIPLYFIFKKRLPEVSIIALILASVNLVYGIFEGYSSNHSYLSFNIGIWTLGLAMFTFLIAMIFDSVPKMIGDRNNGTANIYSK